ncbi:hypothetical protein BKA81DRAFT_411875 [Phyllosticta paracitricarpa]
MGHLEEIQAIKRVSFSQILQSGEYSDLEIRCNEESHRVHKAIVCPQSEFFQAACKAEHGFKEAKSGVVEMNQVDRHVVRAIVQHLYGEDYDVPSSESEEETTLFHVHVYGAAEMYQISGLKEVALIHFRDCFPKAVKLEKYAKCISTAYRITREQDRDLRDYLVKEVLQKLDSLSETPQLSAALEESASFGKDLVFALHKLHLSQLEKVKQTSEMDPMINFDNSFCAESVHGAQDQEKGLPWVQERAFPAFSRFSPPVDSQERREQPSFVSLSNQSLIVDG